MVVLLEVTAPYLTVENHCLKIFGLIFEEYIVGSAAAFCNTISPFAIFLKLFYPLLRGSITSHHNNEVFFKSGLRLMGDDANYNI